MSTAVATRQNGTPPVNGNAGALMESVMIKGDLSKLTPHERSDYYMHVCKSVGLNPLTQPFQYITLNGKLTLYASKGCTDQLSRVHGIKVVIVNQSTESGLRVVHVRAETKDGRATDEIGAVNVENLKGEALANAMMKAVTKAKRRAILSMCGLGMLDETETETIPGARPADLQRLHAEAAADPVWDGPKNNPAMVSQEKPDSSTSVPSKPSARSIRGVPLTIPDTWQFIRGLEIKGKNPYSKLKWSEVDSQPDPSPFINWLEDSVNKVIQDANSAKERGQPHIPLPAAQRALVAFSRLLDRRAGTTEDDGTAFLTTDEMDAADAKLARENG